MNGIIIGFLVIEVLGKWLLLAGLALSSIVIVGIIHDVWVGEAKQPWLIIALGMAILVALGIYALTIEWRDLW